MGAGTGGADAETPLSLANLNVGTLLALGENPQQDLDTMFLLISGFIVRLLFALQVFLCGLELVSRVLWCAFAV